VILVFQNLKALALKIHIILADHIRYNREFLQLWLDAPISNKKTLTDHRPASELNPGIYRDYLFPATEPSLLVTLDFW